MVGELGLDAVDGLALVGAGLEDVALGGVVLDAVDEAVPLKVGVKNVFEAEAGYVLRDVPPP